MSRAGMSALVQQVRALTGAGTADYAVGTANHWDADQVEQVLDRHRIDLVRHRLTPDDTYVGGGSVVYTTYRSAYGNLEAGTALVVQDGIGDARGTATYSVDHQLGVFTFTSDQAGTALYLTGRSYDPYGAAGEVLEEWAAYEARSFDFSTDGQSYTRSQKATALREAARAMRKRARVGSKLLRTGF